MFTFILIYLIIYILIYINLLHYVATISNPNNNNTPNFTHLLNSIRKYTNANPIYFFLFFLSGLPPVSLFLIKVNLLLVIFNKLYISLYIIMFLNLLFGMFFYLQIFSTLNITLKVHIKKFNLFNSYVLAIASKLNTTDKLYQIYRNTLLLLLMNFFSIYFYIDLYLILLQYQ